MERCEAFATFNPIFVFHFPYLNLNTSYFKGMLSFCMLIFRMQLLERLF